MRNAPLFATVALGCLSLVACDSKPAPSTEPDASGSVDAMPIDGPAAPSMTFFITSKGLATGGDFRRTPADTDGLAGADEFCRSLAAAANPALGAGPWRNQKLVMIAASVADLIDPPKNLINKANGLDEKGMPVPGVGDTPVQHDVLTGTLATGLASANTCANWTSSAATGVTTTVGHFDRDGGGNDRTSWSSAHASSGCSAAAFAGTGGRGSIYCFVAN
jgi:hypothetical protein